MVPLVGLLTIQSLPGDGEDGLEAESTESVDKQAILPGLGRADLLKPDDPRRPKVEAIPPRPEDPEPKTGEDPPPAPDESAPDPDPAGEGEGDDETELEGEAESGGPGMLPSINAGDGPGAVEGVVYDKDGNGIPGVFITLPDQGGKTISTDETGAFRVTGLPAAGVTAQYLKLGYEPKVDVIQVREEGVTKLRVSLELKPVELADGEYLLDAEEFILPPVEEADRGPGAIANTGPGLAGGGLNKEFLSKSGATDAAGAVEKISGANIVGGKFVVVRGLGDRYNNTTLNGGIVPSPETSRKAVQLDLFPSSALEGVGIEKTLAPNLPADYVGGLVQLQTLTEVEEDFFSVKIRTNFDQITQSNGEFLTVPNLGLSSDLKPTNFAPIPALSTRASGPLALSQRQAFFEAVKFRPTRSNPDFDRRLTASFAKTWELSGNSTFQLLGTIRRNREQRYRDLEQSRFKNFIQLTEGVSPSSLDPRFADLGSVREFGGTTFFDGLVGNFVQDTYTQSEDLSLLLSGKLSIGNNLDLNGSFFSHQSGESAYTLIDNGVTRLSDFDLGEQEDALARNAVTIGNFAANSYRRVYDLIYRDLQFGQIGGVYRFDDWREGASLSWNAYQGETSEVSPRTYELRGFFLTQLGDVTDPITGISLPNPDNLGNPNSSSIVQFETSDESSQYKADAVFPLLRPSENRRLNLIGGFSQYRRQRNSVTSAGIIANGRQIANVEDAISASDRILNDREEGSGDSIDASDGFVPGGAGLGVTPEYLGRNEIAAHYLGLDAEWDSWFLLGGLRFEEELRGFEIPGGRRPIVQTDITSDFYPSLKLGRYFGIEREVKLDLSYSESVIRPTFYEFIPARILDLTNQRIIVGNRDLRQTSAQNFDLSLSWKRENNYAGINVFHKIINDPIFTVNDPSGTTGTGGRTFVNLGETEVSGIELEASRELGSGFSVTGNLSLIESAGQPGIVRVNNQFFEAEIDRLEGQPNLLGNFILSWENETGLSSNLIYNYTGEYLTVASLGFVGDPDSALPNEVRQPFHSLDWNLVKEWESNWAEYSLKLQIRNLLDSKVEILFEGLADSVAPAEAFAPGRQFALSFEAKF